MNNSPIEFTSHVQCSKIISRSLRAFEPTNSIYRTKAIDRRSISRKVESERKFQTYPTVYLNKIMNNATNYPSCIKIVSISRATEALYFNCAKMQITREVNISFQPSANSKQTMASTMFSQKFDIREALTLNNELISLANRKFGEEEWSHSITNQTIGTHSSFHR